MARVWEYSRQKEGALLVLLAIADFADDEGNAFPSVPRLAHKARLSDRQTQRLIRKLEEDGELKITPGTGRSHANTFTVLTGRKGVNLSPITPEIKGDIGDRERVTLETIKGDIGDSPYKAEPSREPPEESLGAKRATPPPTDFAVTPDHRAWAARNVPQVNIRSETEKFLDHFRAKGAKFRDWNAAWRNWMRNAVKFDSDRPRTQAELNRGGRGVVQ